MQPAAAAKLRCNFAAALPADRHHRRARRHGRINFHVGEEVHRLTGGCLLVIPPHITHYVDVQGDEEVLELDVFTPKRPEYGGGA